MYEKILNDINQQKSTNQNHHDISPYPSKNGIYKTEKENHKNKKQNECLWYMEKREPLHIVGT